MKTSASGNTVYLETTIWYNAEQDNIHITAKNVTGFHTTVNGKLDSKRGHPNLYMKLAKCLRDAGAPHPDIAPDE